MSFRILFDGTVAKHVDSPDDNEDAYRKAEDQGRVVLSDGASESFDARSWAHLVVERFLEHDPSYEEISACVQAYSLLHDQSSLSWSKAGAYERGSFATLLVAQDDPVGMKVNIASLGDSLAVWSDGVTVLGTSPYKWAEEFKQKPILLASRLEMNVEVDFTGVGNWKSVDWGYEAQGYRLLFCMTDALGAWLLRHQEDGDASAFERLREIRDHHELVDLVEAERKSGRMRRDDSTLIIAIVKAST